MKVESIIEYYDNELGRKVTIGESIDVANERAEKLIELGLVKKIAAKASKIDSKEVSEEVDTIIEEKPKKSLKFKK